MNLKETLISMRDSYKENFPAMFEKMKRKAECGFLEGVSVKDIESAYEEILKEDGYSNVDTNRMAYENLVRDIADVSSAVKKYEYLEEKTRVNNSKLKIDEPQSVVAASGDRRLKNKSSDTSATTTATGVGSSTQTTTLSPEVSSQIANEERKIAEYKKQLEFYTKRATLRGKNNVGSYATTGTKNSVDIDNEQIELLNRQINASQNRINQLKGVAPVPTTGNGDSNFATDADIPKAPPSEAADEAAYNKLNNSGTTSKPVDAGNGATISGSTGTTFKGQKEKLSDIVDKINYHNEALKKPGLSQSAIDSHKRALAQLQNDYQYEANILQTVAPKGKYSTDADISKAPYDEDIKAAEYAAEMNANTVKNKPTADAGTSSGTGTTGKPTAGTETNPSIVDAGPGTGEIIGPKAETAVQGAENVASAGTGFIDWVKNNPVAAGVGGVAIAGGVGYLVSKLIQKIKDKKRGAVTLKEDYNFNYDPDTLEATYEFISELNESEIFALKQTNSLLENLINESVEYSLKKDEPSISDEEFDFYSAYEFNKSLMLLEGRRIDAIRDRLHDYFWKHDTAEKTKDKVYRTPLAMAGAGAAGYGTYLAAKHWWAPNAAKTADAGKRQYSIDKLNRTKGRENIAYKHYLDTKGKDAESTYNKVSANLSKNQSEGKNSANDAYERIIDAYNRQYKANAMTGYKAEHPNATAQELETFEKSIQVPDIRSKLNYDNIERVSKNINVDDLYKYETEAGAAKNGVDVDYYIKNYRDVPKKYNLEADINKIKSYQNAANNGEFSLDYYLRNNKTPPGYSDEEWKELYLKKLKPMITTDANGTTSLRTGENGRFIDQNEWVANGGMTDGETAAYMSGNTPDELKAQTYSDYLDANPKYKRAENLNNFFTDTKNNLNNVASWAKENPVLAGAAGFATVAGGAVLINKLIQKIREKKRQRALAESLNHSYLFNEELLDEVSDIILLCEDNEINQLKSFNEFMYELLTEAEDYAGYNLTENVVSDARIERHYSVDNYIARHETGKTLPPLKQMIKLLVYPQQLEDDPVKVEKEARKARNLLNKIRMEPELKDEVDALDDALAEKPIDKKKVKACYKAFVSKYNKIKPRLKKEVRQEMKAEKILANQPSNRLYETYKSSTLEELLNE